MILRAVKTCERIIIVSMMALFFVLILGVSSYAEEYTVGSGSGDITAELRRTLELANDDPQGEILYVNIYHNFEIYYYEIFQKTLYHH